MTKPHKLLDAYAKDHNLRVVVISYYIQGTPVKRKGYDLVREDNEIVASFEPCSYSDGSKWNVRKTSSKYRGPSYVKRITASILEQLDPKERTQNYLRQ